MCWPLHAALSVTQSYQKPIKRQQDFEDFLERHCDDRTNPSREEEKEEEEGGNPNEISRGIWMRGSGEKKEQEDGQKGEDEMRTHKLVVLSEIG